MRRILLLVLFSIIASRSLADSVAHVEVFDRTLGITLTTHAHHGRLYVAGESNHQYELRIRNRSGRRVLAVVSVDGVNVITGETASERQSGYVLDPYGFTRIEGWRKSLDDVATFYFTNHRNAYASRTGRPNDVGVIGVALFEERSYCCSTREQNMNDELARAPSAAGQERPSAQRAEPKLGTGHGVRESSSARYVDFERASPIPTDTMVIYYDSTANLMAQGVLPRPSHVYAQDGPRPFPNGFVPDP